MNKTEKLISIKPRFSSFRFRGPFREPGCSYTSFNPWSVTNLCCLQDEPPEHDFAAIKVPFSLLYVENDDLMGPESMRAVIKMLNATDFRIIHGDGMRHIGVVLAADSRCYIYNDLLYRFNKFENGRGRERNHYRSKVAAYLKKLPFGDGCIGKTS